VADLLGDIERLRGVRDARLGPRPRERLDAEQRARADVADRLERGADVPGRERAAQRADLLGAGDGDAVADVVEVHDRRTAVAVCLVERRVGLGEQRVRLVARPQDARAEARRAQGGVEAPGDGTSAVRAAAREDHRELVAADPVGAVAGAQVAEDRGRAAQERVAVRVAVAVVEELKSSIAQTASASPWRIADWTSRSRSSRNARWFGRSVSPSRRARRRAMRWLRTSERPPTRLRGDEPPLELVADHQIAGGPEQDERGGDRERKPHVKPNVALRRSPRRATGLGRNRASTVQSTRIGPR
jgi:hypothetical protein